MTAMEISEVLTHLAVHAGFPASLAAAEIARPLLEECGLIETRGEP
jgi:4-carboxymuconolactone decarboxylase